MFIYDRNGNGLFNLIGAAAGVLETLNPLRSTIIPKRMSALAAAFKRTDLDNIAATSALEGLKSSTDGWVSYGSVIGNEVRQVCESVVSAWAAESAPQLDSALTTSLEYLIAEMRHGRVYVTACGVTADVSPDASNLGNTEIAISTRRGNGRTCEHALSEPLVATLQTESGHVPIDSDPGAAGGHRPAGCLLAGRIGRQYHHHGHHGLGRPATDRRLPHLGKRCTHRLVLQLTSAAVGGEHAADVALQQPDLWPVFFAVHGPIRRAALDRGDRLQRHGGRYPGGAAGDPGPRTGDGDRSGGPLRHHVRGRRRSRGPAGNAHRL